MRGSGNASVYGAQLASAYMEYWTDGYFTFGGRLGFQYPDERHPTFSAFGAIDFWLEAQSGGQPTRFQGDGQLTLTVYGITSSTHGFFNNDWMAGCIGHALTGTYNVHTRVNNMFIGCDLDDYTLTPTRERRGLTPADLATASQALPAPSARAFTVGAGERALVLEVMGDGGAPKLTLTDPKGRVYTPADTPQKLVTDGAFRSAYLPEGNATLLRVERPLAGEWVLTPQPGSPAIAKVTSANALPAMKVSARVTGSGRKRTLTWKATGLGGRSIRFAERGKNTGNTIVVTKKASGRVNFALQGGSAGVRTIEAQVSADGIPVSSPVVARYRAPGPPRPGRPARLRVKRSGGTVTVRWARVKGAQGYSVRVTGADGRREVYFPSAKRPEIRILTVAPTTRLKVRVAGWMGTTRITGRERAATVAAVKPAKAKKRAKRKR